MYKPIQAFFKTEDDAETVKANLNSLEVNDIRIDEMPDADRELLLTPLAYSGNQPNASGAGGGMIAAFVRTDATKLGDDSPRKFTIECEVEEEDYQKALKFIMDHDGYVDKNLFDEQN